MNVQKTATTLLLITLLGTGIVSCNRSQTAKDNQGNTPTETASPSPERAQRRLAMQTKIKAVLTPAQVQQLDAKLKTGDKMREAMKTIDLTTDQKAKIKEIYQAARAEREKSSGESSQ